MTNYKSASEPVSGNTDELPVLELEPEILPEPASDISPDELEPYIELTPDEASQTNGDYPTVDEIAAAEAISQSAHASPAILKLFDNVKYWQFKKGSNTYVEPLGRGYVQLRSLKSNPNTSIWVGGNPSDKEDLAVVKTIMLNESGFPIEKGDEMYCRLFYLTKDVMETLKTDVPDDVAHLRYMEFDPKNGFVVYVTDYKNSIDAGELARAGRLDPLEAVQMGIKGYKVAHALAKKNMAHNDFHWGNIAIPMVWVGGKKVLDPSQAYVFDMDPAYSAMGFHRMHKDYPATSLKIKSFWGTLRFAAPERLAGYLKRDELGIDSSFMVQEVLGSARGDVYSMGCTLGSIVTGMPPYALEDVTFDGSENDMRAILDLHGRGILPFSDEQIMRSMFKRGVVNEKALYSVADAVKYSTQTYPNRRLAAADILVYLDAARKAA